MMYESLKVNKSFMARSPWKKRSCVLMGRPDLTKEINKLKTGRQRGRQTERQADRQAER